MVDGVKLPMSASTFQYNERTSDLDQCRLRCLNNCSCTAYAISAGAGGCVVWMTELVDVMRSAGGQTLHFRLAAADLGSVAPSAISPNGPAASPIQSPRQFRNVKNKMTAAIIVAGVLLGALLLSCICCLLRKRKKRRRAIVLGATNFFNNKSNESDQGNDLNLPVYDFGTIATATDNFSEGNKLGQGGFGPVYMGKLGEDQVIAVKRLAKTSQQGTEEFKNEVMLIAKLQNINLVRLLGCCIQGEERMLIYEYMPNKSLDAFLFGMEFME